jgi:predicted RNA binding protein YcfA (HicA-like mRNA interferase family)
MEPGKPPVISDETTTFGRDYMASFERNSREIVRRLQSEGWMLVSVEGSHHKFRHPDRAYPIIVPHPKKNLPTGTARAIAKAAGWLKVKP